MGHLLDDQLHRFELLPECIDWLGNMHFSNWTMNALTVPYVPTIFVIHKFKSQIMPLPTNI